MDYCGPNKITVKIKYPLPTLTSAFELLQVVTIFKKQDLHNAYHLVRTYAIPIRATSTCAGVKVSLSSGFHPLTNGVEQTNQELETALCCIASTNETTWSTQLA